jgi:hypothetical protein
MKLERPSDAEVLRACEVARTLRVRAPNATAWAKVMGMTETLVRLNGIEDPRAGLSEESLLAFALVRTRQVARTLDPDNPLRKECEELLDRIEGMAMAAG